MPSTAKGWNVEKAFKMMLNANRFYWDSGSNFNFASCGVMQAAYNLGFNVKDVINAFKKVGVVCDAEIQASVSP